MTRRHTVGRVHEIDVLQPSVAAFVDADVVLRPEFDRILDLASDDRADIWLGDADDPLRDAVLLLVELLDDERSQRHAGGRGGTPAPGLEERTALGLDGGPVDHVGENDILVLRIELHPAGLVESVEGQLLLF